MRIVLPWPPSLNGYYVTGWRKNKQGQRYRGRRRSDKGVAYRQHVGAVWLMHKDKSMFTGPVKVVGQLHPPTARKKMDEDNYKKALYDALSGRLWKDDSQVRDAHWRWCEPITSGRVVMDVTAIDWWWWQGEDG